MSSTRLYAFVNIEANHLETVPRQPKSEPASKLILIAISQIVLIGGGFIFRPFCR